VLGLDARLAAARREGGADLPCALDLAVLVDRAAELRAHGAQRAGEFAPFAGQRQVITLHADGHIGFGDDAVAAVVAVDRGAK
jgi:hypothetical protein